MAEPKLKEPGALLGPFLFWSLLTKSDREEEPKALDPTWHLVSRRCVQPRGVCLDPFAKAMLSITPKSDSESPACVTETSKAQNRKRSPSSIAGLWLTLIEVRKTALA